VPLERLTEGLVERLKLESGERVALQQQLAEAQASMLQAAVAAETASSQLDGVRAEREALQERNDVLGANLAMMEARMGRLLGQVQVCAYVHA
jgi:hypothetical protein